MRYIQGLQGHDDHYLKTAACVKHLAVHSGPEDLRHSFNAEVSIQDLYETYLPAFKVCVQEGKVDAGAIATGRQALHHPGKPESLAQKQAFAAVGQARLMMVYQRLFAEYNQVAAQVLMTKDTMTNDASRYNARNTFDELLKLGAVPVVNENDTVSTSEIPYVDNFGDNDRLSAIVSALIGADLLILLSDIDGLFTDDPRKNPEAEMIPFVPEITKELLSMGKET